MKTIMKKIVSTLLFLFMNISLFAQPLAIQVKGNKFVDKSGKEIIFRGLCYSDPVTLERNNQWNERYFQEAAAWGANIVRFAVLPTNLNSMGWEKTFKYMDQGIEWAKKYNMYVII